MHRTQKRWLGFAAMAATAAASAIPAPLHAADPPPTGGGAALEERVRQLEATVRRLQEELDARGGGAQPGGSLSGPGGGASPSADASEGGRSGLAVGRTTAPADASGQVGGFWLQSSDGSSRLHVGGYIQSDFRYFPASAGELTPSTFLLRRARPVLEGFLFDRVAFRLMPDFGGGKTVLQDAYGEVRFTPSLQLRAGKFKPPVSLERLQSAKDVEFVERSLANNLAPNRDVGFQIAGAADRGTLEYALGLFNGVPDGVNGDLDGGDDKDIAARIFARPFKNGARPLLRGLGLGVAGTLGRRTESLSALAFKTAGGATFFKFDPGAVGAGTQWRLDPQVNYYHGPLGLMGEYITSHQRAANAATVANLAFNGWFLQGSWVATGERASFEGVTPAHPFGHSNAAGAVELAARYSRVGLGRDVFKSGLADPTTSASGARAITLGVNWYLNRALKMQFDYEHTDLDRQIKVTAGLKDHEDAVLSRMQVSF